MEDEDQNDLETFLDENGFHFIIDACRANGVDSLQTLKQIVGDANECKEFIPQLGQRIKLKAKLDGINLEHNQSQIINSEENNEEISEEPGANKVFVLDVDNQPMPVAPNIQNVQFLLMDDDLSLQNKPCSDLSIASTSTTTLVEPANGINEVILNFNISQLLDATSMGRAVKALYKAKKTLSSKCQSYLVEIIVQHFINAVPFRRLTNEDFRKISKLIVEEFPNELPQVYFTSPIRKRNSRDQKTGIARGKLVDKYRNRLTFLRDSGILLSSRSSLEVNDDTTDASENFDYNGDHDEIITWLKNNQEPWSDVVSKWNATYEYRQRLYMRHENLQEILAVFPIIQNPLGHRLIDIDFEKRFPSHNLLYNNFETVFNKLLELKKKSLNQSDSLIVDIIKSNTINNDSRHYLMLMLLPALLPTKTYNKKGKNSWYPTSTEIISGIVIQVKIPGDIPNIIDEKRKKLVKYGLPLLPFVIIEGASYTDINQIYVSYDSIMYRVVSVLKAVDICFQLMHTLNLKYPYECEHVWMFIQLGIYNLKTVYDKIPNILDIVNKIKSSD
ncbi:uncharacterized protein LOC115879167 isoform X2 [Sitophilus oryzae]|uniref:Uncharacterized protein LOC115878444 isoform X2 n=1 Tax=Sitophilus oryzae TaxID=7048 RepID=A0A6J2XKU6_SITOR|nr:uncharacterized protein LOC115878444 isoform X2 [Sitophilus oryzae]XP_030751716.1 uncharacterized protein LOC115879167 isoform X2 [Sitophilus oryzae]